jgi:GT2 family glycosyltransferase
MNLSTLPQVVVIVLNWNGADDTLECLASLKKSSYPHVKILVVDNGSTDNSVELLRNAYPDLWLIKTGANLGFAGGNNVGIRAALAGGCDVVVLLNNDTTVAPDWLDEFARVAQTHPAGSVLGAKIFYTGKPSTIWHFGGSWDKDRCRYVLLGRGESDTQWSSVEKVDLIIGCCMWLPRTTIEAVGLLEEAFFLNYEETDWCCRALRAGFPLYSVPRAKVWHKISASFKGRPHNAYFIFRNRRLWVDRQFSGSERERILRRMVYPEERRFLRKYWLRLIQKNIYRFFGRKLPDAVAEKLQFARAALAGVADYRAGRFGDCPDWVKLGR